MTNKIKIVDTELYYDKVKLCIKCHCYGQDVCDPKCKLHTICSGMQDYCLNLHLWSQAQLDKGIRLINGSASVKEEKGDYIIQKM